MTKVKLPKDVAEALTNLQERGHYNSEIVGMASGYLVGGNNGVGLVLRDYTRENEERFGMLISALVNGYEVEKSPEELVREYYERLNMHDDQDDPEFWEQVGIVKTLDILDKKIEGVND